MKTAHYIRPGSETGQWKALCGRPASDDELVEGEYIESFCMQKLPAYRPCLDCIAMQHRAMRLNTLDLPEKQQIDLVELDV